MTTVPRADDLARRESPTWFDDAKLGVLPHWCPATVPAYAPLTKIWDLSDTENDAGSKTFRYQPHAAMYQNTMEIPGSPTARYHAETYGDLPYDAFGEEFRDEMIPRWDAETWADLFERSGVRYVVMPAKLDDGFLLWPSAHPNPKKKGWQSERDVLGELASAVRERGLRFGVFYSTGWDWTFRSRPMVDGASARDAIPQGAEYLAYADAHWRELIDRYEPSVLWNDIGYPAGADLVGLFRHYFERVPDGVVNNRFAPDHSLGLAALLHPGTIYSDFTTPEYSTAKGLPEMKWETCRGLGLSFGFNRQETEETHLSSAELIHLFVDIVARGGNLLLDVGPSATGEIPWVKTQRLLDLGWWLRVNGEAIYGTRPWQRAVGMSLEGLGVRYTASNDAVHAIVLGRPAFGAVEIDVRLDPGAEVSVEGRPGTLAWTDSPIGVRVSLPQPPDDQPALALRMSPPSAVHPHDG